MDRLEKLAAERPIRRHWAYTDPAAAEDEDVATRPQTELQRRVRDALATSEEAETERRAKGGPGDLGEVDRELTMIEGALQGVYQRVGEVVAAVRPVLDPKALHALLELEPPSLHQTVDELSPRTVVGERVRRVQHQLTELEHALAFVGQGVRL